MADLSQIFGGQPSVAQRQGRRDPFALAGPRANEFKRKLVMSEAQKQDLAPEDGDAFFSFVENRLFQLGDTEGAMATNQRRQEMMAAQGAAQQQGFENDLARQEFALKAAKFGQTQENEKARIGISQQNADAITKRLDFEVKKYAEGGSDRELDRLIKKQDLAGAVLDHEIKGVELQQERTQLEASRKELKDLGLTYTPKTEIEKKTVVALNRGALAMRVLATEMRDYVPSDGVLTLIDAMKAEGGTPFSDIWNQFKKRGGYRTLSQKDRRFLMHALSISDLDLRPVSGAALSAAEVAGSITRLMSMPGDGPQVVSDKQQARADVWRGLAGTLPPEAAASGAFPQQDEGSLLSDEQLRAIANGANP